MRTSMEAGLKIRHNHAMLENFATYALRLLVASIILLSAAGCATQWQQRAAGQDNSRVRLVAQKISTTPKEGIVAVDVSALQPGDILFSAEDGWNSNALRLFSNSAVSHAFIYLGDGEAAEAVGHGGVQIISMEQARTENNLLVAYRRPDLRDEEATALRQYVRQLAGRNYNYWGIVRHAPYTITRKTCELPVLPRVVREWCVSAWAMIQVGPGQGERFFCSEFVVNVFNHIQKPLTSVPPAWVNPADLLHMRVGDVPSIPTTIPLRYVGHLRCTPSPWNLSCKMVANAAL